MLFWDVHPGRLRYGSDCWERCGAKRKFCGGCAVDRERDFVEKTTQAEEMHKQTYTEGKQDDYIAII